MKHLYILAIALSTAFITTSPALAQPVTPFHLWSSTFGSTGFAHGVGVAMDSDGNVLLTGFFEGTADFGGGPLTSAGLTDIFVVKLDADGNHLWSLAFGGTGDNRGSGVAVDGDGNILLTGQITGTVGFGGGPLTSVGGSDIFVVKLDADGNHLWSGAFGDTSHDFGKAVAVDGAGDVLLTGQFTDTVDFGGEPLISAPNEFGDKNREGFAVKLNADGNHVWSLNLGGPGSTFVESFGVAVDGAGNVVFTGSLHGTKDFGGGPLTGSGGGDIFAVKLDSNANHLWSRVFGDTGVDAGRGVAVDSAGNVVLTGAFHGTVDFGGGPLTSVGGSDIFVVKLDADGNHLWSGAFGDTGFDRGFGVAVDGAGNVVLTGTFRDTVDFGGGPLAGAGFQDIFAVELDPDGNHLWSRAFGGISQEQGNGVAADSDGNVVLTGAFHGTVDFGGGPLTSAGSDDIFVVKLKVNHPPLADAGLPQSAFRDDVVSLDGSASSDPDGDPLTFSWTLTPPAGSAAALSDATAVKPSFTVDLLGDYAAELTVNDGFEDSAPDAVTISTSNAAPVADAGPDQAITLVGTTVTLDGSMSFDPEGDAFTFAWTLTSWPTGSAAALSDSSIVKPTFVADVNGTYEITLVVTDEFGAASTPDSVTASFDNVQPVADAGGNQAVVVGDLVTLDGSGSSDANGDPLTFSWSEVSKPSGSTADLTGTTASIAFTADLAGTYIASLVVNDGIVDSAASNATVEAITAQEATLTLLKLIEAINALPKSVFKNDNMPNALTNKINAVLADIEAGDYEKALNKLQSDILRKTDGCAISGVAPDKNDWIRTCDAQNAIYPLVLEAIAFLEILLGIAP